MDIKSAKGKGKARKIKKKSKGSKRYIKRAKIHKPHVFQN